MRYIFLLAILLFALPLAAAPLQKGAQQPKFQTASGATFGPASSLFTMAGCPAPTPELWEWLGTIIVAAYVGSSIVTFFASATTGTNGEILGDAVLAAFDWYLVMETGCTGSAQFAMLAIIFLPGAVVNHGIRSQT